MSDDEFTLIQMIVKQLDAQSKMLAALASVVGGLCQELAVRQERTNDT